VLSTSRQKIPQTVGSLIMIWIVHQVVNFIIGPPPHDEDWARAGEKIRDAQVPPLC